MSTPTLFLSVLLLVCVAFPAQLYRVGVMALSPGGTAFSRVYQTWGLALVTCAMAGLAWTLAPIGSVSGLPGHRYWVPIAVAAGLALPALEIGLGYAIARLRRRRVGGVALHEHWPATTVSVVAAAVVVAVAEEVVFRVIGIGLLTGSLGWPVFAAVLVTSVGYALNHLYFGWLTVAQKLLSGTAFGALYVLSGESLAVPIVAHVTANLVVLLVLPRWKRTR